MGERSKTFRWAQPGGHVHCFVCRRPLEVGDAVRVAADLAAHAFCHAPKWDDTLEEPPRPTVLTMDAETGEVARCGWPVLVAEHQGRVDPKHDAFVFDTVWVEMEFEPEPDPDDPSHLAKVEPLPGCPAPTPRARP